MIVGFPPPSFPPLPTISLAVAARAAGLDTRDRREHGFGQGIRQLVAGRVLRAPISRLRGA